MTATVSPSDPSTRPWSAAAPRPWDLVALGVLAAAVRLPAYFAGPHLTFDDGVFGASAIAMRHGGAPFREVFSSQGPLFLPVVWLGDLLGGRTMDSPRIAALCSGIALALLAYWTVLAVVDRRGALVAGGLVALSGTIAWISAPAAADGPALVFALWAVGLALRYHRRPTWSRAVWIGVAVGAALSIKAVESHILVPVVVAFAAPVVIGLRERRLETTAIWRAVASGAMAAGVFVASALPFGWSLVWDQSVTYHSAARDGMHPVANTAKIISTLWDRDLVIYFVAAVWVASALWQRTRGIRDRLQPSGRVLLVAWAASTVGWLAFVVSPMWRPHVSAVALSLSLVLACWLPSPRIVVVCALVSLPLAVVQLHELLIPPSFTPAQRQARVALRALPRGAWAISDDPGVVWRAGRRSTDDLVDTSILRVEQHRLTATSVAAGAADPHVCAVVATSPKRFGSLRGLPGRLAELDYVETVSWGSTTGIWVRRVCAPPGGAP